MYHPVGQKKPSAYFDEALAYVDFVYTYSHNFNTDLSINQSFCCFIVKDIITWYIVEIWQKGRKYSYDMMQYDMIR